MKVDVPVVSITMYFFRDKIPLCVLSWGANVLGAVGSDRTGKKRREMRWSVGLLCLCVIHLQVNSIFKAKPYSRGCRQTGFPGSRFSLCLLVRTTKVVHMTSKLPLQTDKQRERERERAGKKRVAVAFTAHRALNESYLEMVWTQRSLSEEKKK